MLVKIYRPLLASKEEDGPVKPTSGQSNDDKSAQRFRAKNETRQILKSSKNGKPVEINTQKRKPGK